MKHLSIVILQTDEAYVTARTARDQLFRQERAPAHTTEAGWEARERNY